MINNGIGLYGKLKERQVEVRDILETSITSDVCGIVAGYMQEPSAELVVTPLIADKEGVRDNEKNRRIVEEITLALASSDFDPMAKRAIFDNALRYGYEYKINEIMDSMRSRGEQIILDHVDMSSLDLREFNLAGISAVNTDFSKSILRNLSAASLINTKIESACLEFANLDGVFLTNVCIRDANLKHASMFGAVFHGFNIYKSHIDGIKTNDEQFQALLTKMDFSLHEVGYTSTQYRIAIVEPPQNLDRVVG